MTSTMDSVTELLVKSNAGDIDARGRLFQALYGELHKLARSQLNRAGNAAGALNTTSLLHESYLKLIQVDQMGSINRAHFFAYASKTMRSVIVDLVRERMTERRGSGLAAITLNTDIAESFAQKDEDWIRINDALEELGAVDERLVRVVEMRFFSGLTEKEIGEVLGLSERTVKRDWDKARLLLMTALK
jgi:RNA polymerase sigma factor (TIGR02999 family)